MHFKGNRIYIAIKMRAPTTFNEHCEAVEERKVLNITSRPTCIDCCNCEVQIPIPISDSIGRETEHRAGRIKRELR